MRRKEKNLREISVASLVSNIRGNRPEMFTLIKEKNFYFLRNDELLTHDTKKEKKCILLDANISFHPDHISKSDSFVIEIFKLTRRWSIF